MAEATGVLARKGLLRQAVSARLMIHQSPDTPLHAYRLADGCCRARSQEFPEVVQCHPGLLMSSYKQSMHQMTWDAQATFTSGTDRAGVVCTNMIWGGRLFWPPNHLTDLASFSWTAKEGLNIQPRTRKLSILKPLHRFQGRQRWLSRFVRRPRQPPVLQPVLTYPWGHVVSLQAFTAPI